MKVILHDLTKEEISGSIQSSKEELVILTKKEKEPHYCIGCFGCWIKNPGECVIKDGYEHMGEYVGNCEEFIIISKCIYGEFSPYVKTLIDRSISTCHPFFTKREGMMHHRLRYDNNPKLTVYCYSEGLTEEEKRTFTNRCKAMAIDLGTKVPFIHFINGKQALGGVRI
ncbi:MAG: flavodoxin family protein [Lachnospiraceae bacterium]|nr:flavodoxin family protein [Lachnospiraceae bacterium]